jgi:DNA ligase-1
LSDEQLDTFHKKFQEHIIPNPLKEYYMSSGQEADIWFEPSVVWEIRGADIQLSPVYTAAKGLVDEHKVILHKF